VTKCQTRFTKTCHIKRNKNVATAIKSFLKSVFFREGGSRIKPQVLSTQSDRRNMLITLIARICLQHLWVRHILSYYYGLLSRYDRWTDNGRTDRRPRLTHIWPLKRISKIHPIRRPQLHNWGYVPGCWYKVTDCWPYTCCRSSCCDLKRRPMIEIIIVIDWN